ncbi:MAG: tRNA pseudouridine(38-40) synthase TruA [Vicinamibacteria bacterium]|nr:tRNA pseudouridine(38-40) synthase TruA [Vicinamibacteria bacterium]
MFHYQLMIAYDGTDFAGFQFQSSDVRTVQGVLESALSCLDRGHAPRVKGAGRTDAGVHASGQVVSFALSREWAAFDLKKALNAMLPADMRALDASRAKPGFDACRDAVAKLYRYVLDMGAIQMPSRRRFCAHVVGPLDEKCVRDAAALFLGRQDFASLASSGGSTRTTVRHVRSCDVRFEPIEALQAGRSMIVDVEADGFLRKMARSLVGGIIAAGLGRRSPEDLRLALARADRKAWPSPAPARGLTLVRVDYSPLKDENRSLR